MIQKVASNSGPLIHLAQINKLHVLDLFGEIVISNEVLEEVIKEGRIGSDSIKEIKNLKIIRLSDEAKDFSQKIRLKYEIDLGEATALALAIQEKIAVFITDDLDARETGKFFGLEVHGTIGIILRAFREKIISKEEAIDCIKELKAKSTIYLTDRLIEHVLKELSKFTYQ